MFNPIATWRRFLARPNDDRVKVFGVAVLVALFSAVMVSVTSVALKPLQDAHIEAERLARMERMLDTLPGLRDLMVKAGVDALESRLVDLETGTFLASTDLESFSQERAETDPDLSIPIPKAADVAQLGRRASHMPVHFLERNGELLLIVLPISGG